MFYFIIAYEMYYLYTFKSQKISVDFKKKDGGLTERHTVLNQDYIRSLKESLLLLLSE